VRKRIAGGRATRPTYAVAVVLELLLAQDDVSHQGALDTWGILVFVAIVIIVVRIVRHVRSDAQNPN
jgi:hypothetical protein